MEWIKSSLNKWGSRLGGIKDTAGEKLGGGIVRDNQTKADKAQTWAFSYRTNSVIERVKAMAMKMVKELYERLNKSAMLKGQTVVQQREVAMKGVRNDLKNGLNVRSVDDITKAVDDRIKGRNPLLEQQKEKLIAQEKVVGHISKGKTRSEVTQLQKGLNKNKKEVEKLEKRVEKGKDAFTQKINKAQQKVDKQTKALDNIGLKTPDIATQGLSKAQNVAKVAQGR